LVLQAQRRGERSQSADGNSNYVQMLSEEANAPGEEEFLLENDDKISSSY